MIASDGREIVFAGAGILWGATTVVRGVKVWRAEHKISPPPSYSIHTPLIRKVSFPTSVVVGFAITLSCVVYLAQSLISSRR